MKWFLTVILSALVGAWVATNSRPPKSRKLEDISPTYKEWWVNNPRLSNSESYITPQEQVEKMGQIIEELFATPLTELERYHAKEAIRGMVEFLGYTFQESVDDFAPPPSFEQESI